MGLNEKKRTFGDIEVTCEQLPALRGFALMAKLVKLAGAGGLSTSGIIEIFGNVDPGEVNPLACEIFGNSTALLKGKLVPLNSDATINLVFRGKISALIAALVFAVEVNFNDFSDGAPGESSSAPEATVNG